MGFRYGTRIIIELQKCWKTYFFLDIIYIYSNKGSDGYIIVRNIIHFVTDSLSPSTLSTMLNVINLTEGTKRDKSRMETIHRLMED